MNQTKKRLSIINLAISITDIETIQLQILKLGLLKTDTKIQEIISVLQSENYVKAQRLIKAYIDTPMEEILQRASQHKSHDSETLTSSNIKETIISEEDQKVIDEFQLFTTATDNSAKQVKKKQININDYMTDTYPTPNSGPEVIEETQTANFDPLLNIEADEIIPDNTELDIKHDPRDSFFDIPVKEESANFHAENVSRDTFFDTDEEEDTSATFFDINKVEKMPMEQSTPDDSFESLLTIETEKKASLIKEALNKQAEAEKTLQTRMKNKTGFEKRSSVKKKTHKATKRKSFNPLKNKRSQKRKVKSEPENYPPISYIRQKFVSMRKQYEPIQEGHHIFTTVETFLTTISEEGYKEKEIEETLNYVEKLIKEQKFAEAAQLLLLCASTESKFAQLMLARELYRGILLRKKVSEAFTILTHMADENYPEALCDLGQFHENGISTARDKKVAKELYKRAMDLGIKRAEKHYARMKKETKVFFK